MKTTLVRLLFVAVVAVLLSGCGDGVLGRTYVYSRAAVSEKIAEDLRSLTGGRVVLLRETNSIFVAAPRAAHALAREYVAASDVAPLQVSLRISAFPSDATAFESRDGWSADRGEAAWSANVRVPANEPTTVTCEILGQPVTIVVQPCASTGRILRTQYRVSVPARIGAPKEVEAGSGSERFGARGFALDGNPFDLQFSVEIGE